MPKITDIKKTPLLTLIDDWKDCTRCPLHAVRKSVVMVRGQVPATVCFVGESPGDYENIYGVPFYGPAGDLLNSMIRQAIPRGQSLRMAFMNLVGCIPKDENPKRKGRTPLPDEIKSCAPRIDKLLSICKPKLIVTLGKISEKQSVVKKWDMVKECKVVHFYHPSWLLNLDDVHKPLEIQRTILRLEEEFIELLGTLLINKGKGSNA